jgi:60 kDa SS-A/Ro ribonucleoprotein
VKSNVKKLKSQVREIREMLQTHAGGPAVYMNPETELLRAVASCMLFENTFYESGNDIAERIARLSQEVEPQYLAQLAIEARTRLNLRHVSLFLAVQLLKHHTSGKLKADTIEAVIQRADELAEIFAIYWRVNGKHQSVASALKRGVAAAFLKFTEYQLAKYNRPGEVKLRDALFLSHAKPDTMDRARLFKRLVTGTMTTPDTWEVAFSGGADKRETFERLLRDHKLGYLALLRNLRNMEESGVDRKLVVTALLDGAEKSRALPFRYVAAYRFAPTYSSVLDTAMMRALLTGYDKRLPGNTVAIIDVSGSMDQPLSAKSQLNRIDAASALAVLCREVCDDFRCFTFSEQLVEVRPVRGLQLVDAIHDSQPHLGTYLRAALIKAEKVVLADRYIVITDEQSHDGILAAPNPSGSYLVNVATYEPGLHTDLGWTRINGFSERLVDFIDYNESFRD